MNYEENLLVRGYAAWAAEQIEPRPHTEPGCTYHVSQQNSKANDNNPGNEKLPWKTIQQSAETLRPGDTVIIHAGTYREFVRPFLGGTGIERMITYLAVPGEKPVLKGSDEWKPEWCHEEESLWSTPCKRHPWDHPESWPEPKSGPMHRAEQIFVDGKLLTHVATYEELEQQPDSFFTDDESERLWVHLAGNIPPSKRFVERSMRQQIFAPAVRGLGYINVQGLTMQHAANPESSGANWSIIGHRAIMSVRSGHHWIIENNTIEWGNAQGLDIGGEGWGSDLEGQLIVSEASGHHQVRQNSVNYNGVAGIVGWGGRENHLLLEDNETHFNCQKGNFYDYEAAGVKLHQAKDCIIRRHRSHGNNAFGIWLDHRCECNRVTQCILTDNVGAGFFFEVSAGPMLADNNVILGTRDASKGNWGEGIYSHDGNNATYINNFISGCKGFGVRLRNLFDRVDGDKPTTTSHNRILGNFLFNNRRGAISLNPEVPKAEDNYSDQNILWDKDGKVTMRLEDAGSGIRWEDTPVGQKMGKAGGGDLTIPLEIWQELIGHDRNSLLTPAKSQFPDINPERIREILLKLWHKSALALNGGYADVEVQSLIEIASALKGLVD